MDMQILAIMFNHTPSSATTDALNIRRNASQFITPPEWQRTTSVNPEDSPAAYSLADSRNQTLTIQAKFMRSDPQLQHVEIRALDAGINPKVADGWYALLIRLLAILFWPIFGSVLGEVKRRTVAFQSNGETAFETFELKHVRLWTLGTGVRDITWRWQYRLNANDKWKDMRPSTHRIYSLPAIPTAPWQQAPFNAGNLQLPWIEVLDRACRWAEGTRDTDIAAGQVTRAIYELGPATVTYDCPGGGSTHYGFAGQFNCTAFLDRLSGGVGNGYYVNCTDCSMFVSTFANALGADLWQSRMGYGFDLNEGLSIGSNVWQTACNWGGFSYHEVAWKGACSENEAVFDACLQVDGDADPTAAPHTPLLPVNLRFGNPGDGGYRDRLCTVTGRPNCNPQPAAPETRRYLRTKHYGRAISRVAKTAPRLSIVEGRYFTWSGSPYRQIFLYWQGIS